MRHKALESYPGVYVSLLIVTVFLGSAQGGAVGTRLIFPDLTQAPSVDVGYAVLNPLAQATEVTFTGRNFQIRWTEQGGSGEVSQ